MRETDLFAQALGLASPWFVDECLFDAQQKQLDLYLDFTPGGLFACPHCDHTECKAYDTEEKIWRHLNFFEHVTYLHARMPRIECPRCGVKTVSVSWAREDSGFTLLFEAFILTLAQQMPMNAVSRLVGEYDTRLWRILHHYVEQARDEQDYSSVEEVGVDETASTRGHHYITVFVDMEQSKVLFATPGKDAATVTAFEKDLKAHDGNPEQIQEACCDMSPAFIAGIGETFPQAEITFDKFHVMKIINEAVDQVRREEQKEHPELKKSRYVWLKNPSNRTVPRASC